MHLPAYGWKPIILTVDEKYYEQGLDPNLEKLLPGDLRIEKVKAMRISKPRILGDIGLRAFRSLYRKAKQIIKEEKIDFLYITIPSFYAALLGRWLHRATKIPYGIDYQDPWVHQFPGSEKIFSRHWFATQLSKLLEPVAVKRASLVTGVAEAYYRDVVKRNPHLNRTAIFASLPIGAEPADHEAVNNIGGEPYLFRKEAGKIKLIYAGTMLPKAYTPFELICRVIQEQQEKYSNIEIHFVGSGKDANDPESFNVKPLAEKYGLWEKQIFEYPARIPYLDVLIHLKEADGVFILGSTEVHYSPSKVYQGIASGKPLFAVLHSESTAVEVIRQTNAGIVLTFDGEDGKSTIYDSFDLKFSQFLDFIAGFKSENIVVEKFRNYFASSITGVLVDALNRIVPDRSVVKKILIISPHFPPSNLTAVHRSRLFSQHLSYFGWTPIILTVDENFYEEKLDYDLLKLVSPSVQIEKVNASKVHRPRIVGDIGLRAFYSLYRRAKEIIKSEKVDFLYIIIPSFYGALWGRWLHSTTGIKYGIDYIDPWVHLFPGGEKIFSRAWFATKFSRFLEPIAVKRSSLISGVAESYYKDVFTRNRNLSQTSIGLTLPPAAEQMDFDRIPELNLAPSLFHAQPGKIQLVYAGAMLPKAFTILETMFRAISDSREDFESVEFHFIGTGKSANDSEGYNIKPLAVRYGLWEKQVFEYPARIPYLDVLVHLNEADGVFILGSTEPHYTPSKVYQAVLSRKPIFAILHKESSGVRVICESHAGIVIDFDGEKDLVSIRNTFVEKWRAYIKFLSTSSGDFKVGTIFQKYSAKNITGLLAEALDQIVGD